MHTTKRQTGLRLLGATALAGLASALFIQNRVRAAERENPPLGHFLDVDGVRLHYVEAGAGPPLVLLHGNMVSGLDFFLGDLVEMLAARHRVIVFDRPGFGYSERPRGGHLWDARAQARLLRRALDVLTAEDPVIVGHSWGALVAVAMALENPARTRGLVLLSGYYYPTARADVALVAPAAVPILGDVLRHTVSPLVARATWSTAVRAMFAPAEVPERFWRFPAWIAARPSQLRATAAEAALMAHSARQLEHRYSSLSVPTVLVAGEQDHIVDVGRHSARLSQDLQNARLVVVPGAGHMIHHSAPSEVRRAIESVALGTSVEASG
jgi:pimeloyl-ACP methyl ester carboxylesterase